MKNKYFYKGISLAEYCKENNLSYRVILNRIRLLKKDNPTIKLENLIETVLFEYKRRNYYYHGITFTKYCKQNNLNKNAIQKRINKLKNNKKYKDYTSEEIIELAIEMDSRVIYSYKGMTIKEYCKKNNLKLTTIKSRIENIKANPKYKNYSSEQIVELAIFKDAKRLGNYTYEGKVLSDYCKENNLSEKAIRSRIAKLKKQEQYQAYTDFELLKESLQQESQIKYVYKGERLSKYCKENNLNERLIRARIFTLRKNKDYRDYTPNKLLELAIQQELEYKQMYKGMPLIQYCKLLHLNSKIVKKNINKIKQTSINDDENKIIEKAIKQAIGNKYIYKGKRINSYCKENKLDLDSIIKKDHKFSN